MLISVAPAGRLLGGYLGHVCSKYNYNTADSTREIWVTTELGESIEMFFGYGNDGAMLPWIKPLAGHGFTVLLMKSVNKSGFTFSVEVLSVQKKSLPDSLFEISAGAREIRKSI